MQLGLYEQLAEGWMGRVAALWRQHHFCVAGQLDGATRGATIADMQTTQLGIVLGETTISVCVSISRSRTRNSALASVNIASKLSVRCSVGWNALDQNAPLAVSRR